MFEIIALFDNTHMGDKDNALGVAHELAENLQIKKIRKYETNEEIEFENKKYIIIAAGNSMLKKLAKIKKDNDNVLTIWSGHKLPELNEQENLEFCDIVGLPEYAIGNHFTHKHLIALPGVPNNINKNQLKKEFNYFSKKLPQRSKYNLVFLGGDVPNFEGVKYYNKNSFLNFAQYIKQEIQRGEFFIILNNHRTGKYDPTTNNIILYKKNIFPNKPSDKVSKEFLELIDDKTQKNHIFFDVRSKETDFKGAIATAICSNGRIFVNADSSSILTIAVENSTNVYGVVNEAMDEIHKKHLIFLEQSGFIKGIFDKKLLLNKKFVSLDKNSTQIFVQGIARIIKE